MVKNRCCASGPGFNFRSCHVPWNVHSASPSFSFTLCKTRVTAPPCWKGSVKLVVPFLNFSPFPFLTPLSWPSASPVSFVGSSSPFQYWGFHFWSPILIPSFPWVTPFKSMVSAITQIQITPEPLSSRQISHLESSCTSVSWLWASGCLKDKHVELDSTTLDPSPPVSLFSGLCNSPQRWVSILVWSYLPLSVGPQFVLILPPKSLSHLLPPLHLSYFTP